MTRFPRTLTSAPTRLRRKVTAAVAVTAAGAVCLSMFGGGADAARRTKSTAIADAAAEAVEALDRWEQTLNPGDYVRFVQHRDQAAAMTEADIELLEAGALRDAWAGVSLTNQAALLSAVSQLGVPYRSIASEPGVGFDCSGLTSWAFAQADIELERISRQQINAAEPIDRAEAVPGDLVYYPGHISIYLGAEMMVHSPNSGSHVEVTWLPQKSLRFGDATPAGAEVAAPADVPAEATAEAGSLVDGALTVLE